MKAGATKPINPQFMTGGRYGISLKHSQSIYRTYSDSSTRTSNKLLNMKTECRVGCRPQPPLFPRLSFPLLYTVISYLSLHSEIPIDYRARPASQAVPRLVLLTLHTSLLARSPGKSGLEMWLMPVKGGTPAAPPGLNTEQLYSPPPHQSPVTDITNQLLLIGGQTDTTSNHWLSEEFSQ